jgi:hypothetical protein
MSNDNNTLVKWWTPTGWHEGESPLAWRDAITKEAEARAVWRDAIVKNAATKPPDWYDCLREVGYHNEATFGDVYESDMVINVCQHDDGHLICELRNIVVMFGRCFVADEHRIEFYLINPGPAAQLRHRPCQHDAAPRLPGLRPPRPR